ncbi:MAG: histidine triad nucleotide-binding protein [Elusimicrobia bacterium]|nr:histidine triad nucleotide-binding protein [Elusimicrobiota bacterium]
MPEACILCRIIKGEIPSKPVYDDERVIAIRDINPQAPTHILVVPKKHIASLAAADEADAGVLGEIQMVAKKLSADLKLEGFRLVLNNGRIAGQSVDHIHYHLLGGRRLAWPPG